MKIMVTNEDIAKGLQKSSVLCPVAIAIKRTLNIKSGIMIDRTSIYRYDGVGKDKQITLPLLAYNIIFDYDKTGAMQPFGIDIDI